MQLRLSKLRESKGLSKSDVANILKVHKTTYGKWESNERLIPTRRIIELANLFEVNIDYIVGLTDIRITRKNSDKNLNLKDISIHLKEIRAELNFTLDDIAKLFNIPKSRWSNYENAKYLITFWILIDVCYKSKISIDLFC